MPEAVLLEAVRTPFARRGGTYRDVRPDRSLAHALQGLVRRAGIDPGKIRDVLTGAVTQVTPSPAWVACAPRWTGAGAADGGGPAAVPGGPRGAPDLDLPAPARRPGPPASGPGFGVRLDAAFVKRAVRVRAE